MIDPAAAATEVEDEKRKKKVDEAFRKVVGENVIGGEGYSFWIATFFIVGNMAGGGVLVLPKALADCGWFGTVFIIFCCATSLYAALCLARCWNILEERYEEFRNKKHRKPYPAIAEKAYGKWMKNFVSVILEINFLGVAVVYLLIPAEMIANLTPTTWGITFCWWIIILAAIICPFMWLGTPKDFWAAAVMALVTIIGSIVMLFVAIAKHAMSTELKVTHKSPTVLSFFLSLGSILFAFGGASNIPTFQNDMKNKLEFPRAVVTAFIIVFVMYFPVAVVGYAVYGDTVSVNITSSIPPSAYKTIILFLMGFRSLFVFLMVINASCQEFEDIFHVPNKFCLKRVLVRVTILFIILFIALSIPRFGKILNLVGASAIALACTVFPCLFYYKLCQDTEPPGARKTLTIYEKIILIIIGISGIIGGAISTYSAFREVVTLTYFNPPCYFNMTAAPIDIDTFNKSVEALSLDINF